MKQRHDAAIALLDWAQGVEQAATPGPWYVSEMVNGATIGGVSHKVWPVDSPAQDDEEGFVGIGCACCILPVEDETPETLRYVPANAAFIALSRNMAPVLLAGYRRQLEHHSECWQSECKMLAEWEAAVNKDDADWDRQHNCELYRSYHAAQHAALCRDLRDALPTAPAELLAALEVE